MVKEGYLLLSKGLLTKQNRVQESDEKISIRKDIPTKMDKDKDKDNIVLANTPEYVAAKIKKLKNSPKDTATMMYLNIDGNTENIE
jgi:tryptophanyl-tRNA synthetase